MAFEDRRQPEISRTTIVVGGAVLLAALGLFAVMLAGMVAFGFPANGAAGLLLGTITLATASFAVRFGLKTIIERWRAGGMAARGVRERLTSEHAALAEARRRRTEREQDEMR